MRKRLTCALGFARARCGRHASRPALAAASDTDEQDFAADRARPLSRHRRRLRRLSHPSGRRQAVRRRPADRDAVRHRSWRPTSRRIAKPASAPGPTTSSTTRVRQGIRRDGGRLYPAMPYHVLTPRCRATTCWRSAPICDTVPAGAQPGRRQHSCRSRSTSAPRCASGTGCISSRASSSPIRTNRRMESRRLPGARARPLRRLPHAEELSGRRQDSECAAGRRTCKAGSRPTLPMTARTGSAAGRPPTSSSFLKTGHNPSTAATGLMAEEITHSSSHFSDCRPQRHRDLSQIAAGPKQ